MPFVRRVRASSYRSIADCDVTLGPLTVLLGFNASGKSNFLDVLRFVADALESSPAQAADRRGGLDTLLHHTPAGAADSFAIRLDLALALPQVEDEVPATYGFEIGRDPDGTAPLRVLREDGEIHLPDGPLRLPLAAAKQTARLRLPASTIDPDSPQGILEANLRAMRFYELDTAALSGLDEPSTRPPYLGPAGQHLGHVLGYLAADNPAGKERVDAYLSALVPGALGMDERREGRYSTVLARFQAGDDGGTEVFLREAISEGTLRAAGVLAALYQPNVDGVPLVGIEEPETALHPAGVGALYEALDDASTRTQVIVTSQSSDLLDNDQVRLEHLRAVVNIDGVTRVGEVDAGGRAVVEKGLMSISELHRSGQMQPDRPTAAGAG